MMKPYLQYFGDEDEVTSGLLVDHPAAKPFLGADDGWAEEPKHDEASYHRCRRVVVVKCTFCNVCSDSPDISCVDTINQ